MASRESYSIKNYWKYPRNKKYRTYPRAVNSIPTDRFRSVYYLLKLVINGTKFNRSMFFLDNFKIPFHKNIGCKISKHKWYYLIDENRALCTKCYKLTDTISKIEWERVNKLKQIKKGIKK